MNFFDIGISLAMVAVGVYFALLTPDYKNSAGFKTNQTLRGRKEWNYGHKFLGMLYIIYGVVTGVGYIMLRNVGIELNSYVAFCLYLTLIVSTMPLMSFAIQKKFGKDLELEKRLEEQKKQQEMYNQERKKEAQKKKAAQKKEAEKKRNLREQQKIAQKRKKEKGR